MGLGDALMATSQVKALYAKNGQTVCVVGRGNRPQWSEAFENNPKISRLPGAGTQLLVNGSGLRPYIASKTFERWQWKTWDIAPGEIFLSAAERQFAEPYRGALLVEPHTKVPGGNKAWEWDRWQRVVNATPGQFLQVGLLGTRVLRQADFVPTTFRQALAVLSACRAFVGTEGALHHAAAALNVPAVVLWSEFISPEFTGYASQTNIRHAGPACGARLPCAGCRASMDRITSEEVVRALQGIL